MHNSRRKFIRNSALVSVGFLGLNNYAVHTAAAGFAQDVFGFGPLVSGENDILALPPGFSCKVISRKDDWMSDGLLSPGAHDGMGVFNGKNGRAILVRNHELSPGDDKNGAFGAENELLKKLGRDKLFDFAKGERICHGGTTTLIYNEQSQQVEQE